MLYAFLIYRGGNVVGMCLHAVIGVAHCHSDTAVFQHLNVVATVPESDTFFFFDTEMAQYAFNAGGFAVVCVNEVAELWVPARQAAVWQHVGNGFVAVGGHDGYDLVGFAAYHLLGRQQWRHLELQLVADGIGHWVGMRIDEHLVFGENHGAKILFVSVLKPAVSLLLWNGTSQQHLVTDKTVASVHGGVSVERDGHLGYEYHWTPRGNESVNPLFMECVEGTYGALRNFVGSET